MINKREIDRAQVIEIAKEFFYEVKPQDADFHVGYLKALHISPQQTNNRDFAGLIWAFVSETQGTTWWY